MLKHCLFSQNSIDDQKHDFHRNDFQCEMTFTDEISLILRCIRSLNLNKIALRRCFYKPFCSVAQLELNLQRKQPVKNYIVIIDIYLFCLVSMCAHWIENSCLKSFLNHFPRFFCNQALFFNENDKKCIFWYKFNLLFVRNKMHTVWMCDNARQVEMQENYSVIITLKR